MSSAHLLSLSTAATDIHPPLHLSLQHIHTVVHQLHKGQMGILLQVYIPHLQEELVDVELDRARSNAALQDLRGKVVGPVQRHRHPPIYLLIHGRKPIKVQLRPFRPIVSMYVPDAWCEDVDVGRQKVLDLGRRSKDGYHGQYCN